MNKSSPYHILRVAMAITFFWVGLLILRDPIFWSGFIHPWITNIIPVDPVIIMYGTAVFDIAIGAFMLADASMAWVALLATFHLFVILVVSGIDEITVRDIGLFGGTLALFAWSIPGSWKKRLNNILPSGPIEQKEEGAGKEKQPSRKQT